MSSTGQSTAESKVSTQDQVAIDHLRRSLVSGLDWPTALLEAIAVWSAPEENHLGRHYTYFIAGEAFDLLLLAERLCHEVEDLLPNEEVEDLLFTGQFPASFDNARTRDLLGVDKYRGYLNFFYGVIVEESLLLAAEREVQKRNLSNGKQYLDPSDEAFVKVYRESKSTLLGQFREETAYSQTDSMSLAESREFTYWLFQRRLKSSDKAKIASDTRKGLLQLQRMKPEGRTFIPGPE